MSNLDRVIEGVREVLTERLPPGWDVSREVDERAARAETAFEFSGPSNSRTFVMVEAKATAPSPRDLQLLFSSPVLRRVRATSGANPIMVVAPYLSPLSRRFLEEEEVCYADLTGNVRVALGYPALFILTEGAEINPDREAGSSSATLKGAKAGNLVTVLTEARPPYGVTELADASRLSAGYVSRLIHRLEDDALVEREPRGAVLSVDWPELLRQRASVVSLMGTNAARTFVAREGPSAALEQLGTATRRARQPPVVTGSFAAINDVSVAAPTLLAVYVSPPRDADRIATELGLLPADEGGDVVLLTPPNDGVADWAVRDPRGFLRAARSQVVVDCLSGPGRMPSEGEALLTWMVEHEQEWRRPDLSALGPPGGWRDDGS